MFLGSTGGEGGGDTEVDTGVDIVAGMGTAPIGHVAGELLAVHPVCRAQTKIAEDADVDINQYSQFRLLFDTAIHRLSPTLWK